MTAHLSGHQDIKNNFSFLLASVVPWHWWVYSKSNRPYLEIIDQNLTNDFLYFLTVHCTLATQFHIFWQEAIRSNWSGLRV